MSLHHNHTYTTFFPLRLRVYNDEPFFVRVCAYTSIDVSSGQPWLDINPQSNVANVVVPMHRYSSYYRYFRPTWDSRLSCWGNSKNQSSKSSSQKISEPQCFKQVFQHTNTIIPLVLYYIYVIDTITLLIRPGKRKIFWKNLLDIQFNILFYNFNM